jgi:hypothetical protein
MTTQNYLLRPEALYKSSIAETENAVNNAACEIRVACPGIVQAFDTTEQTVTVRLALREKMFVNQRAKNMQIPDLIHVPVVIPRAGGYLLTLPITAGDECLVVFGDQCIDSWWQSGGVQNPLKLRRHNLSDGFAIVGLWSQQRKVSNYSISSAQLRSEDGKQIIDLSSIGITVTADKVIVNTTGDTDVMAGGNVNVTGSSISAVSSGGTATPLMVKAFLTWFETIYMPSVKYNTVQPPNPTNVLTTVLEAE